MLGVADVCSVIAALKSHFSEHLYCMFDVLILHKPLTLFAHFFISWGKLEHYSINLTDSNVTKGKPINHNYLERPNLA